MSAYARVHDGHVVEVLELNDAWIADLEANSNPKRAEFYALTVDLEPDYDEITHYISPVFTIGNLTVHQSWVVSAIPE